MTKKVEPKTGIEPVNLFLTKEALYRLSYLGLKRVFGNFSENWPCETPELSLERETRLELATFSLEG